MLEKRPDTIHQRIRAHDRYQVEFKLEYELLPKHRTRYKISTYIFTPKSLGVNQHTYAKAQFYRDLQNYVRLKTPVFTLDQLRNLPTSPLLHIGQLLEDANWLHDPARHDQLSNSFKFLCAILKVGLRRHLRFLKYTCRHKASSGDRASGLCVGVQELLDNTHTIAQHYRAYRPQIQQAGHGEIGRAYELADEAISLVIEEAFNKTFSLVDKCMPGTAGADLKAQLSTQAEVEVNHRRDSGYNSLLEPEGDNELFLFRTSVLKKFTSSVLYLKLAVKREGTAIEQMLLALAAGLSMIFATVVAFYAQQRFGMFTLPVFVALVVGYMFKDRIKELARLFFLRHTQNFLFDRRTMIRTIDNVHTLGFLREKMGFVPEEEVPTPILALRNQGLLTEIEQDGQTENILCYTKEVVLQGAAFRHVYKGGPPVTGISDIMRFDMRPYLRKMDDPIERWPYLQAGELRVARCVKTYHINVVTVYTVDKTQEFVKVERTLITLTRDGIRRLKHVHDPDDALI